VCGLSGNREIERWKNVKIIPKNNISMISFNKMLRQAGHVKLSTEKNIQVHSVANTALSQQRFACDPDEKRLH
jgi:hypothetical protein